MQGTLSKTPQKWLVEAINSRIPERYGEVYDYYVPHVYRHALFRLGDKQSAEDVAADTFLRAWEHLAKSAVRIENPRAFLLRIAHNLITDCYRKRSHQSLALEEIPKRQEPAVDPLFLRHAEIETARVEVRSALQELDGGERDLIVWRYIDELSVEEIVEISGKSPNAVYVSVHRALKRLRIILEQSGFRNI